MYQMFVIPLYFLLSSTGMLYIAITRQILPWHLGTIASAGIMICAIAFTIERLCRIDLSVLKGHPFTVIDKSEHSVMIDKIMPVMATVFLDPYLGPKFSPIPGIIDIGFSLLLVAVHAHWCVIYLDAATKEDD